MEDRFETRIDGIEGEIVGLLGVFDGNINNLYVRLALKKDQI